MKRVELEWVGLDPLRSWACSAVRRAEGQAPRERRKASRGRTALLALNAELNCKRHCPWSTERESRRKRRNFKIMLFLAGGRVKENRRALLCKRSGGDGKSARLKSRSQGRPLHGGRKDASREVNRPVNREVSLFRKLNSMVILLYSACADPLNSRGIDASRSSSAASPRATRINLS
jgi:hypothetical protein